MIITVSDQEQCYPALEDLDELGINYEFQEDGKVSVKLDDKTVRIAENCDVTRTSLGVNADYDASSLSYFVIQKNRIVASGNLKKDENDNYVCDGAFRVFSKVNVSTHEYVLAGQVDVSELDRLNVAMIDSTEKKTRSLK